MDRPASTTERNELTAFVEEQKLGESYLVQVMSIANYDPEAAQRYLEYVAERKKEVLAGSKSKAPWHQFSKKVW